MEGMKMANMKMDPGEMEKMPESVVAERPEYPWGLCLNLDNDSLEKLGVKELPAAGSSVMIHAIAMVKEAAVSDNAERGQMKRMNLQITDMGIMPEKAKADMSEKLYEGM